MTKRHFSILALAVGGIAFLQWLVIPRPAPIRPASLAEEPWRIPGRTGFDAKQALAALNAASLWGKLPDIAPDAPLNAPEWRFLGAMVRGADRHVIIKIEDRPEQRLVPGDTLPGGSQILGIESDRLCLLMDGRKRSLSIYPDGPLSGIMPGQEEAPARPGGAKHAKRQNR